VLVRAVAAFFNFECGKLVSSNYWPSYYDFPKPHLMNNALEDDEFNCSKSLIRLQEEVNAAKEAIKKFSPKYCFLDGSIVPQYADKPRAGSKVNSAYRGIVNAFQSLYELAEDKNVELVATVEDSRGNRFNSLVQQDVLSKKKIVAQEQLDNLFDSSLLDYLLLKGERTSSFTYTGNIEKHPVLMDFSEKWADSIYGFYLKPCELDRPLRVEFIHSSGNIEKHSSEIASIVYSLSCLHREYAYPSILIEADLRAKLNPQEIEIVYNKILDKLGKSVKIKMRRDSRPF
jgi:hypothetical protein